MDKLAIIVTVLLLAGCAAQAPDQGESTAPSAEENATVAAEATGGESGRELVCRKEKVMGSIMTRRVCRTRAQAEAEAAAAEDFIRREEDMRAFRETGYNR